jgi:hypothetical protein
MTPAAQLQARWEIMTIPCHARRQWRPAVNAGRDAPMTVGGHHGRVRHQLLGRGPDDRGLESTTRRFRDWTALGCTIFRAAIDSRSTARGKVTLDARCDCAMLHVRRDQGRELWRAFEIWQSAFWQPATINREFADHFRSPNFWRRLYRGLYAQWLSIMRSMPLERLTRQKSHLREVTGMESP